MPDFSAFILRLEKQCCQKAEKDGGGDAGGKIVCAGTPTDIAACSNSITGRYL